MKRIFASMIALCLAWCSYADTVSQSRAAGTARNFFASNSTRSSNVLLTLVWDGRDATTRADEAPAFYVYNNASGGFVIISGEDAARPVLGFSETGSFKVDGMPKQIRGWFDFYKAQIASLRKGNAPRNVNVEAVAAEMWDSQSLASIRRATQVNLNTPTWGQADPYNALLPKVDGSQAVTGCVCTATCEVMYHHKWPSQGHGTLPSYPYETDKGNQRTQPGHDLGATYEWGKMTESYGWKYDSDAANAVARLMFDVGVMLQSSYNGEDYGTGAYDQDVVGALVKYMDYDSSAVLLYREQYSDSRWASMMRAEIDAGRPVIYGGEGDDGGHCFVVDGYKDNNYFNVNWGWDGSSNGWFAISSFIVDGYDFRYYQDAIFGLKKNEGGSGKVMLYHYDDSGKAGIYLKSGSIGTSSFTMGVLGVYNFGSYNVNTEYSFVLADRDGNVKEAISRSEAGELKVDYGFDTYSSCKLSSSAAKNLKLGDRIMYCFKNGNGKWEKIPMYEACKGVDEYAVYHVPFIEVNATATYKAGDLLALRLVNINKAPTSEKWYLDGTALKEKDVLLKAGEHTIKCVAKFSDRTETLVQKITVN